MSEKFEVTWEIDDGYVGPSAPHHFNISADELPDDADDKELEHFFWQCIQEDFEQKANPYSKDETEFIAWAKEVLAERQTS